MTTIGNVAVHDLPWDEDERKEVIAYIAVRSEPCLDFAQKRAEIGEGLYFPIQNACQPWRWIDMEAGLKSRYLAVSGHNVMYLTTKYPVHALNPCPPCCCCNKDNYKEDFAPKARKMIPIEKITDCEVVDSGANELIPPGCMCPPQCNPISLEVPYSRTSINTAGSHGPEVIIEGIEDAGAFRKLVMDLKKNGAPVGAGSAPGQMSMTNGSLASDNSGELVRLLQDIANSNRDILSELRKK